MTSQQIISEIRSNIALLNEEFELIFDSDLQGVGLVLVQKNLGALHRMSIWIDKNGEYTQFYPGINITTVEGVLQPIFTRCLEVGDYKEEYLGTISMRAVEPELFENLVNQVGVNKIESEQDIIKLFKQLNTVLSDLKETFFKKWGNLAVLNEFCDNTPQLELLDYLGNGAIYKKALIYKLCRNPKFDEYFNWIYEGIKNRHLKNPDGDIAFKQNYDVVEEMKILFENMDKEIV